MQYQVYDLHQCNKGEIIQVILSGSAANVRLMDSTNYNYYRQGKKHHYYGGLAKRSPVVLPIPQPGHWYVTIDLVGLRGTVKSSVRKLPSPLPEIAEQPLASVPSLLNMETASHGVSTDRHLEYDVFISHASEDKESVVRPLAQALVAHGLKVWYDEFELRIGDSLRRKIDQGLAKSKFGIVVLSKNFINKGWTNYELDGIISKANTGEQIILPIWHGITKQEVLNYSPSLADKVARNTATSTVNEIASEIAKLING